MRFRIVIYTANQVVQPKITNVDHLPKLTVLAGPMGDQFRDVLLYLVWHKWVKMVEKGVIECHTLCYESSHS